MSVSLLNARIVSIAKTSLASANAGNPFISRADAFRFINEVRMMQRNGGVK
jgi:hypothetical protein